MGTNSALTPGHIGSLSLRNRIVYPPMVSNYCGGAGEVTDRFIAYHAARAQGGCGLLITEATMITPEGRSFPNQLGIQDDQLIPGLKRLTSRIHQHGAAIAVQLFYPGRQTSRAICGQTPASPSPTTFNGESTRELTEEDILRIASAYGRAAARAREAGFDAVEVHGGNGYLLQQFHSRFTNQRNDSYGGSLGNRARFSRLVLREIRRQAGSDYPLILRLGVMEPVENGLTPHEGLCFARILAREGVDAFHVTAGMREGGWLVTPPASLPTGTHLELAAMIRNGVEGIPVIGIGRILTLAAANAAIDKGMADFVTMGRAQIADPLLVAKSSTGRAEEVTPCLSCNEGCMDRLARGMPIECAVNPSVGHEMETAPGAAHKKNILVIGAGPAGCAAAVAARRNGHKVTLLEREKEAGGKLFVASLPPHKEKLAEYARFLQRDVESAGVDLRLNTTASPQTVAEYGPDLVIVATGANPLLPPIPGLTAGDFITAEAMLKMAATDIPEEAIILGGGMVGAECAELLASLGSNVTIVEMRSGIALDVEPRTRTLLVDRLRQLGVKVITSAKVVALTNAKIIIEQEGKTTELPRNGDIVVALGYTPGHGLADELRQAGFNIIEIGDALKAGDILQSVKAGHAAGARC